MNSLKRNIGASREIGSAKKKKVISPLQAVVEDDLAQLKEMVNDGADLTDPCNFQFKNHCFTKTSLLLVAILLGRISIIEFLIEKFPHSNVLKSEDEDYLILLTDTEREQLADTSELIGAACVFHKSEALQSIGLLYWEKAFEIRSSLFGNPLPKPHYDQSEMEKLAFRSKEEINSTEQLTDLRLKKNKHWKVQACLVGLRISKKYDSSPNCFVLWNLYSCLLENWNERRIDVNRAFNRAVFIVELFNVSATFLEELVSNPLKTCDVVASTFHSTRKVLQHPGFLKNASNSTNTEIPFDHLMVLLSFCFSYQVKVHDSCPHDLTKFIMPYSIPVAILLILEAMVSIPKTKGQSYQLKSNLAWYIHAFEQKRKGHKSSLLSRVAANYIGTKTDFKMLRLMLNAGSDPNIKCLHGCNILGLLAEREFMMRWLWKTNTEYVIPRAQSFTAIVKLVMDGRHYYNLFDSSGKSGLECFLIQNTDFCYPNPDLYELLNKILKCARPLTCATAQVIQKHGLAHGLPCGFLPMTLQSWILCINSSFR